MNNHNYNQIDPDRSRARAEGTSRKDRGMATSNGIDVIIPVYNGEKFILQALDSVVQQTLSPTRIIVVDDGSTDNTNKIITDYAKVSNLEIKIIKKENGGLSSARNAGIRESTSEFIAFLDADDEWLPEKLAKQMALFQNSEFLNLGLVYCDYGVMDSTGKFKYRNYKAVPDPRRMRGQVFLKLLERNQIAGSGSGVLVKRQVFEEVGYFDENLRFGEDWDMWLRITEKFEVDFVPEMLVHIRKHDDNMTSSPAKTFGNELEFYKKWLERLGTRYPAPLIWSDKIVFRVLLKPSFLKILHKNIPEKQYQELFRYGLGTFGIYLPIFALRLIFNAFFYPQYLRIIFGYILHKGK